MRNLQKSPCRRRKPDDRASGYIRKRDGKIGGGKVKRVDEPVFVGANGALRLAKRMPEHYWQVFR